MPAPAPATDPLAPAPVWLLPAQHGDPQSCLQRIRWICEQVPDLHSAALMVLATHQGVPREQLAAALHRYRPDLQAHEPRDVAGMLAGLWNGGRDGFEAVLRTRRTAERRSGAMPFIRPD